jgi:deazaflavin-dependent oxidoreductase (nitroreductase family)
MADWDPDAFETALLADMRANDGAVTSGPLAGHPLLIMTATGAKSGQPRRSVLTWSRDGEDYVVAGTAGGAPTPPSWIANLRTNPSVTIEVGNRTDEATATIVEGAERDRLWAQHVAALPHFADYPEQTGRVIPMVRLTPVRD